MFTQETFLCNRHANFKLTFEAQFYKKNLLSGKFPLNKFGFDLNKLSCANKTVRCSLKYRVVVANTTPHELHTNKAKPIGHKQEENKVFFFFN